ncbi:MFS transporter [Patescibacteria group bacterium]|nr:MFS transporter [Patescibacteria group bacterium]
MGKFFKDTNKKESISWAFYDFANSAYCLLILSFVFPIFFRDVIAGGVNGDFWWGLAISVSILLGGIASPIIGAIADHDTRRKRKFIIFSSLSMIGTAALYFTGPNMLLFALILFIITNLCFEIAQTLYDSFLLHVSTEENVGRISGLGWGLGYLGGIVAMLALKPLYEAGYANEALYKLTLPLTALFFFIFALPGFLFIKEHKQVTQKEKFLSLVKIGISNTLRTIKDIKQHKRVAWFLVGFYILNDALVTIFAFIPIYAKVTLKMTFSEITIILLVVQLIGFPAAIFFGWLSDKKGSKKILLVTIILWALIVLGISFATSKPFFYAMAILTGLVIGSSQAIARSWFSKIIPKEKMCEFFGFNGFASKVAATTGPLLFGIISSITANQRIAMGTLIIYFVISFIIFARIKEGSEKICT